jgi:carboxyl-terminal processing protease
MKFFLTLLVLATLSITVWSQRTRRGKLLPQDTLTPPQDAKPLGLISKMPTKGDPAREQRIGITLKRILESLHYTRQKIDDNLSKKAFDEYVKRFDYGKQFLMSSDIKALDDYRYKMDDQMLDGNHILLNMTSDRYRSGIQRADKIRKEVFKKQFDFTKNESIEVDAEKRKFPRNKKEFTNHWRKLFKQSVLNTYVSLKEEQEEPAKDKKKKEKKKKGKKEKKEKKLTDVELRKKAHKTVSEKYERLFTRLLKDDRTDYLGKFLNAMATIFDPHTVYLSPKKKEDFDIDISGQLEGIGAVLQEDGPHIKVVSIVPGGAAWRQKGLEVDDVILNVAQGNKGEAVDLVDMRVGDAVRYIRGKKGTIVKLTVKKADGSRQVIPIVRDVVEVEASYAKASVLEHKNIKGKIGYIHVPKFYRDFETNTKSCTQDVLAELKRLKKQNVSGVILDLRNNGGGALIDAEEMSGLFIPEGPVVQIRDHQGRLDVKKDRDPRTQYDGPLIVMVNRFSASASEILAGAMQDYKRAVIVGGEYTHGKGTVQAVVDLNRYSPFGQSPNPMGALKITIQKFYRITGDSTQYRGITPDIILPDPMGYAETREKDLDNSLPWDRIKAQPFKLWNKSKYRLSELIGSSKKRVKKNTGLKKIKESVDYLLKRKKDTVVTLNLKKSMEEDAKNKLVTEKLKNDDVNMDIKVSHFEASLMAHQKVKKGEVKQWKKDLKQRKEDWIKGLRQDPMLEETLFIMNDMIKAGKGKKVTAQR